MYKIKQTPEDFVVKEIIDLWLDKNGKYFYYLLKKKNYNTLRAIGHIKAKVKYAGNKDKKAVTEQFISVNKKIKNIRLKNLELKFIGRGNEPISLGSHKGNYFEIVARNLNKNTKIEKKGKILNYFGKQRFGKDNVEIGRNIIKRNFKEAVGLIIKSNPRIKDYLQERDYIGALRKIPLHLLKLYIHAYQSYLFNEAIKKIKTNKNLKIPLIGFEFELNDIKNKELKNVIIKIMEKEKITPRDFIIREIPELSSEGGYRGLFMEIKDLRTGKLENDELNKNKYKIKLNFKLDKGCYATVAVKELFKSL